MKKFIGVAIIMLTLVLAVLYRQLTHRPVSADGPTVRSGSKEAIVSLLLTTI
jgi:hypothetical protein